MKNVYDAACAAELRSRILALRADSPRQWGKMDVAQAMAHCAVALEMALGERKLKRALVGRLIGGFVKRRIVSNDAPFGRNAPTDPALVMRTPRELDGERQKLLALMHRFASDPAQATTHPHSFFGPMTPAEWAILQYKHLDHHLRQFGA